MFVSDYSESTTHWKKEKDMRKHYCLFALVSVLFLAGIASAQDYPIMEMIANKVIQKYQQSNCEQLWKQKSEPKSAKEQEAIQILRADPQMRTAFINKVAPSIVNKMFECGMIP